jgi:GT2 family glycosyltransferase
MKLAICMPTLQMMHSRTAMCLAAATAATALSGEIEELILKNLSIAYIDLSRETLAYEVLKMGADAIMWLDHDMIFPADAFLRLMKHNVPIVSCGYRRRQAPHFEQMPPFGPGPESRDALMVGEYVLGGFTLIRREVYEKMSRPWYRCGWGFDATRPDAHIGEDIDFSRRAHEAGFSLLIDAELTKEIGHLAEVEIKWNLAASS